MKGKEGRTNTGNVLPEGTVPLKEETNFLFQSYLLITVWFKYAERAQPYEKRL